MRGDAFGGQVRPVLVAYGGAKLIICVFPLLANAKAFSWKWKCGTWLFTGQRLLRAMQVSCLVPSDIL